MNHLKGFMKSLLYRKGQDIMSDTVDNFIEGAFFNVNITQMLWGFPNLHEIFPSVGYTFGYSIIKGEVDKCKQNYIMNSILTKKSSILRMYHGLPIWLDLIPETDGKRNEGRNGQAYLRTFNTKICKNNLETFLDKLIKYNIKRLHNEWKSINESNMPGRGSMRPSFLDRRRTFNDVFIPENDKNIIIDSIDSFVVKREWYVKNNIPYHFGILLYGEPGTGKSIVAQAIADHLNAKFCVLNGADVESLEDAISQLMIRPDNQCYTVLCIEDIDCAFANNGFKFNQYGSDDDYEEEYDKKVNKRKRRLASILNCMDGVNASDNIIYVLTTNHIETLDPALIRPGRCDLKIEMKGVCEETFRDFCMFHYNEYPDRTVNISNDITFAELQTDVMRGCTINQLIEKLEENNDSTINGEFK
jgi:SpoVK/Ycf46/Vps4 family AAA+-type ATPase